MTQLLEKKSKLIKVNFHGDTILSINYDNKPYVCLKSIVGSFGLDWSSQLQKIKHCHILEQAMVKIAIPTKSGVQESVCLPLNLISGWLLTIHSSKIKSDDIKEKIMRYQRECYNVLHNHFFKKDADKIETLEERCLSVIRDLRKKVRYQQRLILKQDLKIKLQAFKKNTPNKTTISGLCKLLKLDDKKVRARLREMNYITGGDAPLINCKEGVRIFDEEVIATSGGKYIDDIERKVSILHVTKDGIKYFFNNKEKLFADCE